MRIARNQKRIALYAVCACFFCLAGVFQAVDSRLPEFWHALFALSAHTILLSLVVAWGVSLIHRMVRGDLRAYFLAVAALILFFLTVRMIKYGLTKDADTLSRYLWYAYYVPQTLIPPTILLAAFSLERKKGRPLAKLWYLLYLPAAILLFLIFTNDLHGWAFALDFNGGFSYAHRAVFYIALAWEIAVTFAGLVVLILKCSVSACKRKTWIPVTAFTVCAAVSAVCFLTNTPAFKIPELLCFTCIVMIESCIAIGLIPSNAEYETYFHRSAYSAVITDGDFDVVYRSERAVPVDRRTLATAAESPVMIGADTRLSAKPIHGGWAFRLEDLSKINAINAELTETNEQLAEENDIIEAENELKARRAQVDEQNRLFAGTEEVTRGERKRLEAVLSEIGQNRRFAPAAFAERMRYACVLAAYIKRRSNLLMLARKHDFVDAGELSLAMRESLDYLSLTGAACACDCSVQGMLEGDSAGRFYDFFEACIANDGALPRAVIVHFRRRGDGFALRLECDADAAVLARRIRSEFAAYGATAGADDGTVYCSLSLPQGGGL